MEQSTSSSGTNCTYTANFLNQYTLIYNLISLESRS